MYKNPNKSLFIAFEGLDGSGCSTQTNLVSGWLREKGYKAMATKEPTSNIIGGLIRGQLTHDWQTGMECLQLLFAADRAFHLEKDIIPALRQGKIVVSDRYFFSTVAYGSLEVDRNWLLKTNDQFMMPDLTFLLKVSPRVCIKRTEERFAGVELFEEEEKLKDVWDTYEYLAKKFPRVFIIDGERTRGKVLRDVIEIIKRRLK